MVRIHENSVTSHKSQVGIVLISIFLGSSIVLVINSINNYWIQLSSAKIDSNRFYVPQLGGYLGAEWKSYINLAIATKETGVFEEYWGLWSATRKIFPSWPVDSVIHALGTTRVTASKELDSANIIISTRSSISPEWQPWSLSQNYWFYERLLKYWKPSFLSPTTIVWRKNERPSPFLNVGCTILKNDNSSLVLQAKNPGFYEIEMLYNIEGSGRFIAMVRNNISFGADASGYVSINPKESGIKFPMYTDDTGSISLDVKIIGGKANIDIKSCVAHQMLINDIEVLRLPVASDDGFYLTDNNWIRGIARRWAGFIIPNTQKNTDQYLVGRMVKFADGEIREIAGAAPNGLYLQIYLKGDPLPVKVGLPSSFVVVSNAEKNITLEGKN